MLGLFGQSLLAMFGASVLIWALLPLAPGDSSERILQARGVDNPTPTEIAALRSELKLDRPLIVQYIDWLSRAVRGDFSISYQSGKSVSAEIARRLPATLLLATVALVMSIVFALALSLSSVYFVDRFPDHAIRFLTQIGSAIPSFLLGLLLLQFVVVGFGVGKVISSNSVGDVWFPAICLAFGRAVDWTQILRSNLLEAMRTNYSLMAEARGATRWRVLWRYALPNSLLPFLTVVGVGIGGLLGGAAIIETVFSWNGIGSFAVEAVAARDMPVVQGFVVLATLVYVAANFLVDAASALIDPRLRKLKN
ncbi:MAG: ABC transporter permease [Pyrinomonadaceae bacterium]|nr:ABC transporter permease [Pyrinomonadaceae bacterium]